MLELRYKTLLQRIAPEKASGDRLLASPSAHIAIHDLAQSSNLNVDVETITGRTVLIATEDQLTTALALVELDGVAKRIVLCTPDLPPDFIRYVLDELKVDVAVTDDDRLPLDWIMGPAVIRCGNKLHRRVAPRGLPIETEWVLFTSGTTSRPKPVLHNLRTLTGAMGEAPAQDVRTMWSTFYDIRRFGGLQILLRALTGGGSMVLSQAQESVQTFLERLKDWNVTHISGTPSHWRRAVMSGAASRITPEYVRLSGEPCDQAILDRLQQIFPEAKVAHAFASTEAGVAFDVRDGKAGFPVSLLTEKDSVQMRVECDSLRIRSSRMAIRYLGGDVAISVDADGFLDTGDLVKRQGDRYYFMGRRDGVINVGGLKVHPEAVEAIINRHPAVIVSQVSSRASPVTGAIVVADVVLQPTEANFEDVKEEIMNLCRRELSRHQLPFTLRQVPSLVVAESGKLLRRHA
jgi:acyl-coenzyme A synthetase/AMP-(fatty) acid ligase